MPNDHALLPSNQHRYDGLPELTEQQVHVRRERVFLVLAGLFLGTLAMLNILGITRFIKLFEIDFDGNPDTAAVVFAVAVGVSSFCCNSRPPSRIERADDIGCKACNNKGWLTGNIKPASDNNQFSRRDDHHVLSAIAEAGERVLWRAVDAAH